MRTYTPEEIRTFLDALDAELTTELRVTIIGGAAAALVFDLTTGTRDVDVYESDLRGAADAIARAQATSGLGIPMTETTVADAPYEYESRLITYELPRARHLRVSVPEVHDWILMKTIRAYQPDLDAIEDVASRCPIDLDTLVIRFRNEMGHVVGAPRFREQFLVVVELLYGSAEADRVDRQLPR